MSPYHVRGPNLGLKISVEMGFVHFDRRYAVLFKIDGKIRDEKRKSTRYAGNCDSNYEGPRYSDLIGMGRLSEK